MQHLFLYDSNGFFTRGVLAASGEAFTNATTIEPASDLTRPFWTGDSWIEGVSGVAARLSKVAFMDLAYPLLGADHMAGIARYGAVLMQAKASTSALVVAAMERYAHASVFEREDVATFLDILVGDPSVDLTQAERDTIINAWPVHDAA